MLNEYFLSSFSTLVEYGGHVRTESLRIPSSVWYLSFYCNPRLKEIVVCKVSSITYRRRWWVCAHAQILLEGLNATALLYGQYAETYVHTETPPAPGRENLEGNMKWPWHNLTWHDITLDEALLALLALDEEVETGSYDVTRVWSVLFWQTVYVVGVPFMMVLMMMMMMMMMLMMCPVEGDRSGGSVSGHPWPGWPVWRRQPAGSGEEEGMDGKQWILKMLLFIARFRLIQCFSFNFNIKNTIIF